MKRYRFYFLIAVIALLIGSFSFFEARQAQLQHTVIPATQEFGWLSPAQGYLVAAISLFFALYSFRAFVRSRRGPP